MAINIFQGGRSSGSSKANSAGASTRAQQAKTALSAASAPVASDSGSTAVSSSGLLGKIGNLAKKALPIAAKYLPGVAGTAAKLAANVFNDPEWWQHVPGEGVTMNVPLAQTNVGGVIIANGFTGDKDLGQLYNDRPAFVEVVSLALLDPADPKSFNIFTPNEVAITQYLMPEIRKVVNAIPLQTAKEYQEVLASHVTMYALWRQFKKCDYILKHGHTYIPNLNDEKFPIFQVANASWLQSTINRLEEYLRSNVRIPHTLCEYLAWRFGRVYKANSSAKSSNYLYSVVPMSTPIAEYEKLIAHHMNLISSTGALQQANTDLYNAYVDHDMMVEILDETQFKFDHKEFALRANLQMTNDSIANQTVVKYDRPAITFDSDLDVPTTFMASSVSTNGVDSVGRYGCLFPVVYAIAWCASPELKSLGAHTTRYSEDQGTVIFEGYLPSAIYLGQNNQSNLWFGVVITEPEHSPSYWFQYVDGEGDTHIGLSVGTSYVLNICKACEFYNAGQMAAAIYVIDLDTGEGRFFNKAIVSNNTLGVVPNLKIDELGISESINSFDWISGKYRIVLCNQDATALAQDTALVTDVVIGNEHVFAFANLVDIARKTSTSYKQAEKLVAKDVANTIDTMDVAAVKAGA